MELSLFLAKLFGLYMLVMAALMLLRKNQFVNSVNDMMSSTGLLAFVGILNLIVGLAIAIGHPIWELSWRGLITLMGYLSIVRGISRMAFPMEEQEFAKSVIKGNGYWVILSVVTILGAYLTYSGFFA